MDNNLTAPIISIIKVSRMLPIQSKLPQEDIISSTFQPDQNLIVRLESDDNQDQFFQFLIGDTSQMIYWYSLLAVLEFLLIELGEQQEGLK